MNNVEKLRVMLQHWIEHNKGHVEEFAKWKSVMEEEEQAGIARQIAEAIAAMDDVNVRLESALKEAGGPPEHKHGHDHDDQGHHHHHH